MQLREGNFVTYGERRRTTLIMAGIVTSSNDPNCRPGGLAGVTLTEGHGGVPDQIKLSGCWTEQWTSTDRQRVNVHLERPHQVG